MSESASEIKFGGVFVRHTFHMRVIYEIVLLNQVKTYLIADDVDEARAFAFAQSCGLGEIVDFRSIGPALATLYDKAVVLSSNYAAMVTKCRD